MTSTHRLAPNAVRPFIVAGKALFTVLNTRTGNRYTFKVVQKTNQDGSKSPHFVTVLTGPDNTSHYSYIGILASGRFVHTRKSRLAQDDPRVQAFAWLWRNADHLPDFVEARHHSRCGHCNRVLTTPESIDIGLGPVCGAPEHQAYKAA